MVKTPSKPLTLEEFLNLPETKPGTEFIQGKIRQKSIPQAEHSLLQGELCSVINNITEEEKIAYAFPELRCTFGGNSIIPDVSVFRWSRIPINSSGKIANRFETYPDLSIEILSPRQSLTRVLENLLYCSQYGTELGWLIDPGEKRILGVFPEQKVQLFRGDQELPILTGIDLQLTVEQIFNWLKFS
ncbi:Uma2 family endonuclease [Crocosphaera sp.]|uniref:Uma2 family endonuclease n=1 Tax=Crocosphaera sp. TaxID=2729996 RepID=UPI00261C9A38|nr:Uma2 family endonuclease [Crocosphaera sp.]MDJ0580034.1 Uma2 family endonuclease [Crocosphaera sp.]